ncbi:MAG: DUF4402 domain-containing protein [Balneolaceae bacterium]|nr:DUF4402 domain-containing protein [Balneolaceae bacterium]
MKRLFSFLTALVLISVFSIDAFAQGTDNDAMTATASVIAPVNVTAGTTLDFGEVVPNVNKTVNVSGSGNDADVAIGDFTVTGETGNTVQLSFTALNDLTDGGSNTLTIDYNNTNYAAYFPSSGSYAIDGTDFNPSSSTPTVTLVGGSVDVLIGGEAQPGASQAGGTYTGTITLTATYN